MKKKILILPIIFVSLLVGCESNQSSTATAPSTSAVTTTEPPTSIPTESELSDTEKLQAELDSVKAQLDALQEGNSQASKSLPAISSVNPPLKDLLVGEWFLPVDFNGSVDSFLLNADGTGSAITALYVPSDSDVSGTGTGEDSTPFTWSLDGNTVHITINGSNADLLFNESELQLLPLDQDGSVKDGVLPWERVEPTIPEGYVTMSSILAEGKRANTALTRRLLGTWYFDVLTFTFNDDGTGVIDIPAMYGKPGEQIKFDFSVIPSHNGTQNTISIDYSDGLLGIYSITFGKQSGGSVTFQGSTDYEPFMLTRKYDISNSPITSEITQDVLSVFDPRSMLKSLLKSSSSP